MTTTPGPRIHYAADRTRAACELPRPPVPPGLLTEDRAAVTLLAGKD